MKNIFKILYVIGFFSVLNAANLETREKNMVSDITSNKDYIPNLLKNSHSDAWNSYVMDKTLALLYGKGTKFTTTPKLVVTPSVHIKTYFKLKSLAILQEKKGAKNIVAWLDVNASEPLYIAFNTETPAQYTVIAESVNGNYYKDSYKVDIPLRTCGRQHQLDRMAYDKFFNAHLKRNITFENNTTNMNFMIVNDMNGYEVGKKSSFISKIRIEANNKTLLTIYLSEYMNKNPYFDIDLPNMDENAEIKIFCTNTQSAKEYEYKDNLGLRRKIVNPWKR